MSLPIAACNARRRWREVRQQSLSAALGAGQKSLLLLLSCGLPTVHLQDLRAHPAAAAAAVVTALTRQLEQLRACSGSWVEP